MMEYCVYEHWLDGKCIYVGGGNSERPNYLWRNKKYNDFVFGRREEIEIKIIAKTRTKQEAVNIEKSHTEKMMKKYELFNIYIGNNMTPETRKNLSVKITGHEVSQETRSKISNSLKGHVRTKESRERASKTNLEKYKKYICISIDNKVYEFSNVKFFLEQISKDYYLSEKTLYRSTNDKEKYPKSFKKKNIIVVTESSLEKYGGNVL